MTYLKYNFNDEKLRDEKEQTDCVDLIQTVPSSLLSVTSFSRAILQDASPNYPGYP